MKKRVLFICRNNSGRSQMAEGILRHLYGDRYEAFSAGSEPKEINPLTVKVMEEMGVDMSGHESKSIMKFRGEEFDVVVTLCQDTCPVFTGGKRHIHADFPDPAGSGIETFRKVRDEILEWIKKEFKP